MVTEDPVDLNLTMSPSSHKIPALLTKNSAQPCQPESYGEVMWIRVHPTDDDDHDESYRSLFQSKQRCCSSLEVSRSLYHGS